MTESDIAEMKEELLSRRYALHYDVSRSDYKEYITYEYIMMLLYEADFSGYAIDGTDKLCDIVYNME